MGILIIILVSWWLGWSLAWLGVYIWVKASNKLEHNKLTFKE